MPLKSQLSVHSQPDRAEMRTCRLTRWLARLCSSSRLLAMACAASAAQDMTTTQLLENEGAQALPSSLT